MAKIANPQGKGGHLLSNHWLPVIRLEEKSESQIMNSYIKSMLVLSAEFNFRPVPEVDYDLYLWKGVKRLSLIPFEKRPGGDIEPIAHCQLLTDMTWQVEILHSEQLSSQVKTHLQDFAQHFGQYLQSKKNLQDSLPTFVEELPFYRRLYASGLAKSLSFSIERQNLQHRCYTPAENSAALLLR